jgi:hypothetical protein
MPAVVHERRRTVVLVKGGCPPERLERMQSYFRRAELDGWGSIPDVVGKEIRGYIRRFYLGPDA